MMAMPSFEKVMDLSSRDIRLRARIGGEVWTLLEVCAGTCGLHLRVRKDFKVHVFLGTMRDVNLYVTRGYGTEVEVAASCVSSSDSSYLYSVRAMDIDKGCRKLLEGNFLMVLRPFSGGFDERLIGDYFREILRCLKT